MTTTDEYDPGDLPGLSADEDGLDDDPDEAAGAELDDDEDPGEAEPDDPHGPVNDDLAT